MDDEVDGPALVTLGAEGVDECDELEHAPEIIRAAPIVIVAEMRRTSMPRSRTSS